MEYEPRIKSARMQIVADALQGGTLAMLSDAGAVIARVALAEVRVADDLLIVQTPLQGRAIGHGRVAQVQLQASSLRAIVKGLRPGVEVLLETEWLIKGQTVRIDSAQIRHG